MANKQIMDEKDMHRACIRLSHELIERNRGAEEVVLVGIQRRGVPLAEKIAELVEEYTGTTVPVGRLDITFYRDDLSLSSELPVVHGTDIPFSVQDRCVVIVDDVLYTGRTARAALEAIMEFGRPRCIQLMVMVDRGHRELPIRADYVGRNIPTSSDEIIQVCVEQFDADNGVYIEKNERA